MKKIIIVSGYFNPLHAGHIEYFQKAKACGDELCVIVNNDGQRALKGSKPFMNEAERLCIVDNLRLVDYAMLSQDKDRSVCATIRYLHTYGYMFAENPVFFFANGGDQTNEVIPEKEVCEELGIKLIDGLGDKIQSSSWLLRGGRRVVEWKETNGDFAAVCFYDTFAESYTVEVTHSDGRYDSETWVRIGYEPRFGMDDQDNQRSIRESEKICVKMENEE